ncbi:hypothetical protein [Pseudomonas putida]|uniref:Uncharacterized protein n=1 Tax=Pseudomonas putida TaxID=303 RepID=A0A6I6XGP7_PSEPU|nr:hypothetical protein [Pseudomonas putida]QHG64658.2 hypothetical protein C2H86_09630 [Pseudomonas putida]
MLKSYAVRLYVIAWQALRVCAGLLLMMRVVLYSWALYGIHTKSAQSYEPPPVACGKMAGEVYEFSRLYFPFWPEYEEERTDGSYYVERHDCDSNIKLLVLAMIWPALEPAENLRVYERLLDNQGLMVAVTPVEATQNDLRQVRDHLLDKFSSQGASVVTYDNSLRLYRTVGSDYSWGRRSRKFYWSEELGVVTSVSLCNWQAQEPDFYACEMTFVMSGNLMVKVTMSPENFVHWFEVLRALEAFLVSSKKSG